MLTSPFYWSLLGAFAAASAVLVLCWLFVVPRLSRRWRATRRREALAKDYDKLVEVRQEAVYHFYWSLERKNGREADGHEETRR